MGGWANNPFNPGRLPRRVTPDMLIMDRDGITGQPLNPDDQPDDGTATSSIGIPNGGTSAPYDLSGIPEPRIRSTPPPMDSGGGLPAQAMRGNSPDLENPITQVPPQVTPQMVGGMTPQTPVPPGAGRSTIAQPAFGMPDTSGQSTALQAARAPFEAPSRPKQPSTWRSILAGLAGSTNIGHNFAPLIAYGPKGLQQERDYEDYQNTLKGKLEGGQIAEKVYQTDETANLRKSNDAFNQTYKTEQEANRVAKDKENQAIAREKIADQKSAANKKFLMDRLKGRDADSIYQSASAPRPPDYEFVEDPEKPGFGFAVPPAWRKAPQELIPFLPGVNAGDMIPHSQYKSAIESQNKMVIEQAKPKPPGSPEQQFIDEYRAKNPKATMAEAQAAYVKNNQAPDRTDHGVSVFDTSGKLVRLEPGQTAPPGAVTAAGFNTQNVPTAQTRTMAETAPRVMELADRTAELVNQQAKSLGPAMGRWSEFMTGKVGAQNPEFMKLRTTVGLLQTALMRMHSGRGSEMMLKHFTDLIDTSKQDPANLLAAIGEIKLYADQVAKEGHAAGGGSGGPPPIGGGVDPKVKAYADQYFGGDVQKALKAIEDQKKGKK